MSLLSELKILFDELKLPVETGSFSGVPPNAYVVLTPLVEYFELFSDNQPQVDIHEVRISFFSKGNYTKQQKQIIQRLLTADFTITNRLYVGFEKDTGYHHLSIDVAKYYETEETRWQQ